MGSVRSSEQGDQLARAGFEPNLLCGAREDSHRPINRLFLGYSSSGIGSIEIELAGARTMPWSRALSLQDRVSQT